jgi:hypothetical protein
MAGGPEQPSPQAPPESAKQGQLQTATQSLMQAEQQVTTVAQQFPQVSKEANSAVEAIRSLLRRVVANSGQTEPVAPEQIG